MKTVTFKFVETAEPDVEDNEYQVFIDDVESKEYSIQAGVFERYYVANKYMYEFLELVVGQDYQKVAPHVRTKDMAQYFDKLSKGLFDEGIMAKAAKNATECVNGTAEIQAFYDPKEFLESN